MNTTTVYIASDIGADLRDSTDATWMALTALGDEHDGATATIDGITVPVEQAHDVRERYIDRVGRAWVATAAELGYDAIVGIDQRAADDHVRRNNIPAEDRDTSDDVFVNAYSATWNALPADVLKLHPEDIA